METVVIIDAKHPNGEYIINKDDFDPKVHTLKDEAKTEGKEGKKNNVRNR